MILMNGELVDKKDVCISYEDRGYYFGDGVYEVFRIYQGHIYEKEAHFRRLKRSAKSVQITLPYSIDEMDEMIERLVKSEKIMDGTLYMQITRGVSPRVHTFPVDTSPTLIAYCKAVERPVNTIQNGITAITVDDIRWLRCDIKSLNLLPNTLAKQNAVSQGKEEAILHRNGTVTECSASNIMIVQNNAIYTHPANHLILHGITREVIFGLAKQLGIKTYEQAFQVGDLFTADEVFITGTTVEVTPVIKIDDKPIGSEKPGKITKQLQEAFEKAIKKT
jgi:D-alanine transaminase